MSGSPRKAIAISAALRYVALMVQFLASAILARLLTPEDFGIYSVAFSIVALGHLFRDFGLNQYLIQERKLDDEKIRATFFLVIAISWLIGLVVFLGAAPAADFFAEPAVATLMQLLSFNFFIVPFGTITLALLRKELRFDTVAYIGILATFAGIAVAVSTAYQGAKYLCLAYGAITETVTMVLLSQLVRPKGLPLLPHPKGSTRILKFGSIVGLGNIVTQFSESGTQWFIARSFGVTPLGLYSRAYGTFMLYEQLFISAIKPTILPLFAKTNHSQAMLNNAYLRATEYATVFAWPFFAVLLLFTEEVIRVIYGTQWDATVPLIKVLCLGGLLLPPTLFVGQYFIAASLPGITLKIQSWSALAKLALVAVACYFNLLAVSIAIVGFVAVKLLVSCYFLKRTAGLELLNIGTRLRASLWVTGASLVGPIAIALLWFDPQTNPFLQVPIIMLSSALGWLLGVIYCGHPIKHEIELAATYAKGKISSKPY